jgi:hypothetical protein
MLPTPLKPLRLRPIQLSLERLKATFKARQLKLE